MVECFQIRNNKEERSDGQGKEKLGDRFDATLVRNIDAMHWFVPYLYPNRADNEAFIREEFDLN